MLGGAALLLRGIRWRRQASLVLVLCAAVSFAAAAAGPTWSRAARASLLERTLQDAPVADRALVLSASTAPFRTAAGLPPEPRLTQRAVREAAGLPPTLEPLLDGPTEVVSTARRLVVRPAVAPEPPTGPDGAPVAAPDPPLGRLVAREGVCEQLRLSAGRCPTATTEVLLSDRSAREVGVVAGEVVLLPELAEEPQPPGATEPFPVAYTVVGTYLPGSVQGGSRFWFDDDVLEYAPPAALGSDQLPARLDAVLVLPDLVLSLRSPGVEVRLERVLREDAVTLASAATITRELRAHVDDVDATRGEVSAVAAAVATLESTLPGRRLVERTATLVGLQVVVLGWVVLHALVSVTVAARDDELALAKLRGVRGARLAVHVLAEPVALVLLAVPLGLLLALLAVGALAAQVLLPGTAVVLPPGAWTSVGLTLAGAVLACALAATRSLRVPVAEQLRRVEPTGDGRAGTAATAGLATLLAVALVLVLGPGPQPSLVQGPALGAPVLAGLVAGTLTAAAVRLAVRLAVRRTRGLPLGPYLAVRQLAGRSGLTRTTALVTAATAVAGFAGGAYVVTAAQRDAQAGLDVGAERVVHVAPTTAGALLEATREVDPGGTWAMAAVQRGEGPQALLAVDSARYAAAVPVAGGALTAAGAAALVPDGLVDPLVVTGTEVSATVELSWYDDEREVVLGVQLRYLDPDGAVRGVLLTGPPAVGEEVLTAAVPDCAPGCTVLGLLLPRTAGTGAVTGSLDLLSLAVDGVEVPLARDDWRVTRVDEGSPRSIGTGTIAPNVGSTGLAVRFTAPPSATAGIVRRDVPTELPAVVADGTALPLAGTRGLLEGSTLEGGDLTFAPVGRTPAVPRTGQGAVVDLALVARAEPPRSSGLDFQVWLGPDAPAGAPDQLAAAGLQVLDVQARAQRRAELDRSEPARALLLLLGAGAASLVAGVAGVATVLAATARRRAGEAAALRAMAVPDRVVRGSAVLEGVLLLGPGLVAGGLCAAALLHLCQPLLAEVTGASAVVARASAAVDVVPVVAAVVLGAALLLVPVVLGVTRRGDDETRLRTGA